MLVLTVEMLKSEGACHAGVASFKAVFGDKLEIKSKEQAIKLALSYKYIGDVYFLEYFIVDQKAYEKPRETLWEAYEESRETLWEAYKESNAPFWKAYKEAREPLLKAYLKARLTLIAETLWNESLGK